MMAAERTAELVDAVVEFLVESCASDISSQNTYNFKVAINDLKIVSRYLKNIKTISQLEGDYLPGHGVNSAKESVFEKEFSAILKTGSFKVNREFLDYLKLRSLINIAIDNPKYSGYEQAKQHWVEKIDD